MRRSLTLTALILLGSLLFAELAQAGCFGNGAGLFGRRARVESYSAGYGAACYGQSYEAYGASCYGQSYAGYTGYATPARRPVRNFFANVFGGPRPAAVYVNSPSNGATYYYPAPASGYGVGGFSEATPAYYGYGYSDSGYVNPGSPGVYPPSWQAANNCPGGICPTPQRPQVPAVPSVPPTPGKATPQAPSVPPPAPLPPSGPPTGHHQHAGGKCDCGDPKCTHGVGICECTNPACICPEHKHRGKFPR